jgi:uncharacterized membrane protein YphA (DoxX/SURF4 family)
VLDPAEKQTFDGIVAGLRAGDSQFTRRIDRLGAPRRRLRLILAVLLWTIAPVCIVLGGWTGFFMAIAAGGYAFHLMNRRGGLGLGHETTVRRRVP